MPNGLSLRDAVAGIAKARDSTADDHAQTALVRAAALYERQQAANPGWD